MMIGFGFLVMLLVGLAVIGIPVLIAVALVGGLPGRFNSEPRQMDGQAPPAQAPAAARNCPTCGRSAKADWNICPSCGAALVG